MPGCLRCAESHFAALLAVCGELHFLHSRWERLHPKEASQRRILLQLLHSVSEGCGFTLAYDCLAGRRSSPCSLTARHSTLRPASAFKCCCSLVCESRAPCSTSAKFSMLSAESLPTCSDHHLRGAYVLYKCVSYRGPNPAATYLLPGSWQCHGYNMPKQLRRFGALYQESASSPREADVLQRV